MPKSFYKHNHSQTTKSGSEHRGMTTFRSPGRRQVPPTVPAMSFAAKGRSAELRVVRSPRSSWFLS